MNTTAANKTTPQETELSNRVRRVLTPSIGSLLSRGLLALVGIGVVLPVVLGLDQKWLWMRQLDYASIFWPHLPAKRGIFGVALIVSAFCLWLNLGFAASNINLGDREVFFNNAFRPPADENRTINVDISARQLVFAGFSS